MFIFDNKTNIFIHSQELTFKSEYHCDFSSYFKNRQSMEVDALQFSGDNFEGYLSKVITDQVMLELSQRNCLVKTVSVSKMWLLAIPVQSNRVLLQNLYQLEDNFIGIAPPKSELAAFQYPFSNRFQLYVHDEYLHKLCESLGLPEVKNFLNYSGLHLAIASVEKIRHLQRSCHRVYQMGFALNFQNISLDRKALRLNFMKQKLKEEIVKYFLLILAETQNIKPKKNVIRRGSLLKQAEEMMRNNLRCHLTIPGICQELGVSQRALEYLFKDFYEMSPQNYFKKLRLNALHQSITQNPEPTFIYQIAEELGFFHRGHLASDYKQLFGYFPSETLKI